MQEKIVKITVDENLCIGCGACTVTAPDAFSLDPEKGKSVVKEGAENTDNKKIEEAAKNCPVQAIKIEK
jgi:ferredoxin